MLHRMEKGDATRAENRRRSIERVARLFQHGGGSKERGAEGLMYPPAPTKMDRGQTFTASLTARDRREPAACLAWLLVRQRHKGNRVGNPVRSTFTSDLLHGGVAPARRPGFIEGMMTQTWRISGRPRMHGATAPLIETSSATWKPRSQTTAAAWKADTQV